MSAADPVDKAARWLAENRGTLARPIIPALRDRFGLEIDDAIRASVLAAKIEYLEALPRGRQSA
jgi:hypothetical protein